MTVESHELKQLASLLEHQQDEITHLRHLVEQVLASLSAGQLSASNHHFRRNWLPNDSSAVQRLLQSSWNAGRSEVLDHVDLMESGFRVFSQGDEDGILLRIFQQIGTTNKVVVEIGSNCDYSDVGFPENLSSNLIVNHAWSGFVFELDEAECRKIRHFFARDSATKHFHSDAYPNGYFSPIITAGEVTPENINGLLSEIVRCNEPDLFTIDIDGGDFAVVENLSAFSPRVIVVEFEKRFRDRYNVVQRSRADFSARFPQSGAASLLAWQKLMTSLGYVLVSISTSGFNAFFVRSDVADAKLRSATPLEVFDSHPVFAQADLLWTEPDESWQDY